MNDEVLEKFVSALTTLQPKSRSEMISVLDKVLNSNINRKIDEHNTKSVIYIFSTKIGNYALKAEHGLLDNATTKEISWYQTVPKLKEIPKLYYAFSNDNFSFFIIEFIKHASTIDSLVENDLVTSEKLYDYINKAFKIDEDLFSGKFYKKSSTSEVNKFYEVKYKNRLKEAYQFNYLKDLFEEPVHYINGKALKSPNYYTNKIFDNNKLPKSSTL